MIEYKKKILANGLTVVVNRDPVSKLAAVNILYKVGARNENPERTGFAHLFEHLMFRGTRRIPNFDLPVQMACGDNNAFTNNDYTDFYITLPKDNVETALWLESDRMEGLDITPEKLETEKRVVIEEFRQRYLNQPYGDQPMLLRALAYKVHPYRWATIGLTPEHIAQATLDEVQAFYRAHYRPSNAILSISADMEEERMLELAEKDMRMERVINLFSKYTYDDCECDAQGRVLLPQKLRARFLQDAKDVEVSGAGTHIRVMRNEDAQSEEEAFEAEIPDVLAFEAEIAARKNN